MEQCKQKMEDDFYEDVANVHFKNIELSNKVDQHEKETQKFIINEVKLKEKIGKVNEKEQK